MKLNSFPILKAACIVLLIASTCFTVSAEYVIVPYSEDLDIPEELVNRDGADGTLSFWELPLQLQLVSCFCFLSLSSFGVLKFLPFLLGKIRCNKGNKNRQKILSYVSDNPGCAEIDVLKDLGIKRGTFRYHFGKLELVNILVSVRHGRFKRYYPGGSFTAGQDNKVPASSK